MARIKVKFGDDRTCERIAAPNQFLIQERTDSVEYGVYWGADRFYIGELAQPLEDALAELNSAFSD